MGSTPNADVDAKRHYLEESFLHAVDTEIEEYIDQRMATEGIEYTEAQFEVERLLLECLSAEVSNSQRLGVSIPEAEGDAKEVATTSAIIALSAAELCLRLLSEDDRKLAALNMEDSIKRFPHSIIVRVAETIVAVAAKRLHAMGLKEADVKGAILSAADMALRPLVSSIAEGISGEKQ